MARLDLLRAASGTCQRGPENPPQELLDFVARNPWFSTDNKEGPGKDMPMTKMAIALAQQVTEEHPLFTTLAERLEMVDKELAEMYPGELTRHDKGGPY